MSAMIDDLKRVHAVIQVSYDAMIALHGDSATYSLGTDTLNKIGVATGMLSAAKALVARDIQDYEDENGTE